jgi:cytochrome c553
MTWMVDHLSDDYLHEIADYFSTQHIRRRCWRAEPAAAELERGRQLVTRGDPALKVPACIACHGERLTGALPAIPGLLGLPRDYINAQFGAWRNGSAAPMRPIAWGRLPGACPWPTSRRSRPGWRASPRPTRRPAAEADPAPSSAACGSAPESAAMKRRFILIGLAVLLALALLAPAWPGRAPNTSRRPPQAWAPTPANIARGAYLARAGDCMACHTARGGAPMPADARSTRLSAACWRPTSRRTPDTGIGAWSADDFWNALHNGKSRDGRLLYPAFPYTNYTKITRADADALFAYLRSLPPVRQPNQPHECASPTTSSWRWRPGACSTSSPACSADTARRRLEPRRLPGRRPGPLQRLPQQRNRWGERPRRWRRPDPGARLVRAGADLDAEAGLGQLGNGACRAACLRTGVSPRGAVFGPMAEVVRQSLQHLDEADVGAMAAT